MKRAASIKNQSKRPAPGSILGDQLTVCCNRNPVPDGEGTDWLSATFGGWRRSLCRGDRFIRNSLVGNGLRLSMKNRGAVMLLVIFLAATGTGIASAHVSSGLFNHPLETNANHAAGVGDYNCGTGNLWVASGASHQSYDGKTHTASLWNRDYSSSATWSTSWGFNTVGSQNFWPRKFKRIDAASSDSSPIHFFWDLIYPRFKHSMKTWCSG